MIQPNMWIQLKKKQNMWIWATRTLKTTIPVGPTSQPGAWDIFQPENSRAPSLVVGSAVRTKSIHHAVRTQPLQMSGLAVLGCAPVSREPGSTGCYVHRRTRQNWWRRNPNANPEVASTPQKIWEHEHLGSAFWKHLNMVEKRWENVQTMFFTISQPRRVGRRATKHVARVWIVHMLRSQQWESPNSHASPHSEAQQWTAMEFWKISAFQRSCWLVSPHPCVIHPATCATPPVWMPLE